MSIPDINTLEILPRDVSPREYFRGHDNGRGFVVMRYPEVNLDHKDELLNFIKIGAGLSGIGIKTPELYALDEDKCIAQFEDLGKVSFGKYLHKNPQEQTRLYALATDVLKTLGSKGQTQGLPLYNDSNIHKNRRQIVDYYIPFISGRKSSDVMLSDYLSVWDEIEANMASCPQVFVHGDYHLENLMYMDHNSGLKKCALIDYQDALYGHSPYDLVNLLEDARLDVPLDLRNSMIDRYCNAMSVEERDVFKQWYRVLGTQFHCRVIGLFIKLAAEQGRDDYLIHVNRLQAYIKDALQDPLLSPLKSWFAKEKLDFKPIKDLNGDAIRAFFK